MKVSKAQAELLMVEGLLNDIDQYKHQSNLLREDIALLKNNQKTRDKLIDNLKEENANLNNELDQYKTAHDKLTAGLKEAVAESIKYKRERDSLIKDVKKLREEVKSLNRETTKYFEHWQEIFGIYSKLTEHIRLKALHNPSVSRYKDLMHFIDELEGGFYE